MNADKARMGLKNKLVDDIALSGVEADQLIKQIMPDDDDMLMGLGMERKVKMNPKFLPQSPLRPSGGEEKMKNEAKIEPEGKFECPVDYGLYEEEDMFGLECGHR